MQCKLFGIHLFIWFLICHCIFVSTHLNVLYILLYAADS